MNNFFMKCHRWSEKPVVLWAVFSITLVASFYRGYGFSNNSYAIASWLVTYEGGFIKRGLIGSILQLELLSQVFSISVPTLFFWITNILLASLHVMVLIIFMRMVYFNKMALLFIPYFLVGPLLRTQSVWIGNIDHLLAIMMLAITYCLIKERIFLAIGLSLAGIFIHEIIFAMTFPLFSFWLLIRFFSESGVKSSHFNKILSGALINILVLLFIILYHDMFFSGDRATSYIGNLILRQPEDHYNSGAIIEAYSTSFLDWFLSQRGEFFDRIFDPGLFFVVVAPAFIFLGLFYLASAKLKSDVSVFLGGFVLAMLPLAVLVIAWDIDRIWNLSIWMVFLMAWLQLETKKFHALPSMAIAFASFLISIPAFLMPQVRSNIEWSLLWMIYSPLIVWQLVFIVGRFYKNDV